MNFNCNICNINYKTRNGLFKHNKKYHSEQLIQNDIIKKYLCDFCTKELNSRQSKWIHEKKCKILNSTSLEEKVRQLSEDIRELKSKPNNITNNNNTTNNITNNIQYIINAPEASSMNHLTFELQKEVLDKGLNSLVCLIELINFNKSVPENHSYCITAINDKHASVIDDKTNKIIKTNKFDLFDKLLGSNLGNLEKISNNPKFTQKQKQEYKDKINYLKTMMFQNNKFIKRYQNDINIISYNNKNMIKETWKSLKELSEEPEYQVKGFDDLIDELPEDEKPNFLKKEIKSNKPIIEPYSDTSEDDSDEEPEYIEIKIKGKTYILEGTKVYVKTKKGSKGELYGTCVNGVFSDLVKTSELEKPCKVKKLVPPKEIDV